MDFLSSLDWQAVLIGATNLVAIPLIVRGFQLIQAKLGTERYEQARQRAKDVVRAAEILGARQVIEDKKEWALAALENGLLKAGIKVDLETIDNLIESAVVKEVNAAPGK